MLRRLDKSGSMSESIHCVFPSISQMLENMIFWKPEDDAWVSLSGRKVLSYNLDILRIEIPTWDDILNAASEPIPDGHWDKLFISFIDDEYSIYDGPCIFTGHVRLVAAFHDRLKQLLETRFKLLALHDLQNLITYIEDGRVIGGITNIDHNIPGQEFGNMIATVGEIIRNSTKSGLPDSTSLEIFNMLCGPVDDSPLLDAVEAKLQLGEEALTNPYSNDLLQILNDILYDRVMSGYFNADESGDKDLFIEALNEADMLPDSYSFMAPIWDHKEKIVTIPILIGTDPYEFKRMTSLYKDQNVVQYGYYRHEEDPNLTIIYQFNINLLGEEGHTSEMYAWISEFKSCAKTAGAMLINNTKVGSQPGYLVTQATVLFE
jgi:hypothetical protein